MAALEEARRLFDLSQASLVRLALVRLNEQQYVLLVTLHHVITDWWSTRIFISEMGKLYQRYSADARNESDLEELPIQYADYAVWQREWLQGDALERELEYWRAQLETAPAVLQLPMDKARPAIQSFRNSSH